jgi:hypothetical protein
LLKRFFFFFAIGQHFLIALLAVLFGTMQCGGSANFLGVILSFWLIIASWIFIILVAWIFLQLHVCQSLTLSCLFWTRNEEIEWLLKDYFGEIKCFLESETSKVDHDLIESHIRNIEESESLNSASCSSMILSLELWRDKETLIITSFPAASDFRPLVCAD